MNNAAMKPGTITITADAETRARIESLEAEVRALREIVARLDRDLDRANLDIAALNRESEVESTRRLEASEYD